MNQMTLEQFLSPEEHFGIIRVTSPERTDPMLHTHDFAELLWLEEGGLIHMVNGQRDMLTTGEMVFVRPQDKHTIHKYSRKPTVLTCVFFAPESIRELQARHFESEEDAPWFMGADQPKKIQLDANHQASINHLIRHLSKMDATRLNLDWFMLNLFRIITVLEQDRRSAGCPNWLQLAIAQYNTPGQFVGGVQALAELAEKSPEHVSRSIQKCFSKTASQLINEIRLNYAARLLRMTDMSIQEIAAASGYQNLGYFYRRFHQIYRQTPKQYRQRKHHIFG